MKTKKLWGVLLLLLCASGFTGCHDDDEGRKVTDYKELMLTVASKKVPGVILKGNNSVYEVYAVKNEQTNNWIAYDNIAGFEYKKGYEYKIKVSETSYLDCSMGDPAWTERDLLEVISKVEKESEDLPLHLVPESYYKCIPFPRYRYAVKAENKSLIEEDLKANSLLPLEGHYLYYGSEGGFLRWMGIFGESSAFGPYTMMNKHKKPEEMPESYKLLSPEGRIELGGSEWTFLDELGNPVTSLTFDVFIGHGIPTRTSVPTLKTFFFYKDLTQYYQHKYPEAGVETVVVSYTIWTAPIIKE